MRCRGGVALGLIDRRVRSDVGTALHYPLSRCPADGIISGVETTRQRSPKELALSVLHSDEIGFRYNVGTSEVAIRGTRRSEVQKP
jgi:hypothetical protein